MSWNKVKLGEILKESRIPCENPNPDRRIKVKLKVLGVEKRGLENEVEGATKQYIRKAGQFIYGKQNFHKGAFGIIPEELDGYESSADLPAFDISEKCLPEWIFYYFKQGNYYLELSMIARGVATQRIHPEQIFDLEIPLPDLKIQEKLLKKIKSLEKNGDDLKTELTYQFTLVKKLRQQLLQDAVQGKLVPQNPKDEPASELLKKIKTEKEKLIAEKKLKKEKELPSIKPEEIPFEIPENWVWCRLGDLGVFRRGPFGSALTKGIFVKEGYKVYEQRNAIYDNHTLGEYFVTKEKFEELKAFRVFPNDLIVSCSGATLGRIAEIPEVAPEGIMNQALMRIKLFNSTILNSYFIRLFRSPFMQKNIFSQAWGSAIPNMVGLVEIKKILIPLPPLSEQNRIVQKLDELMQYCNELEASIKQSESQSEKLLQQVLREALRGKPVEA